MLTSSDIRIHRATATEAEAIAGVHVRAWRAAYYEHGRWAADGRRRSITIGGQEVEEVRYRVRLRAAGGRPGEAASARLASR